MNENATTAQPSPQVAMIRTGLLDRLKTNSGIRDDESFARKLGISRATLHRLRKGDEPSIRAVVTIAGAFGLGLGEVVEVVPAPESDVAA